MREKKRRTDKIQNRGIFVFSKHLSGTDVGTNLYIGKLLFSLFKEVHSSYFFDMRLKKTIDVPLNRGHMPVPMANAPF